MTDQVEQKRFTCPRCGSHKFGTHVEGAVRWDLSTSTGACHGYTQTKMGSLPCGFTWPRTDDAKYFRGTGVFMPVVGIAQAISRK